MIGLYFKVINFKCIVVAVFKVRVFTSNMFGVIAFDHSSFL